LADPLVEAVLSLGGELELEPIQTQMAQKAMLRAEKGARAYFLRESKREEI
jgi:hypothetical protein